MLQPPPPPRLVVETTYLETNLSDDCSGITGDTIVCFGMVGSKAIRFLAHTDYSSL